jgi:hypothetical protein
MPRWNVFSSLPSSKAPPKVGHAAVRSYEKYWLSSVSRVVAPPEGPTSWLPVVIV